MPHYTEELPRIWLIIPLLMLYLPGLGSVGFLGPDEPRYASIGREMAHSKDLITPRLDGQPWFEKPPLLYWMVAAGHWAHLPDEWAARLPVALSSVVFLLFFFWIVRREFSTGTAIAATAILSTSAGWLAYSFAALTDLPMSVTLAAALFLASFDTQRRNGYLSGALLGLSVLAKGFVPLVLFAPAFLVARRRRLSMMVGCALIAAPWYILCFVRNGRVFWSEFFWKHHVERFFSNSLEHVQPFWFYLPVILAALFPWTPLAALLLRSETYRDVRIRFLTGWVLFGLLFFSISRNKLPGYLLPLLPALAIVLAVALERSKQAHWWVAASALLLVALPAIAAALPDALMFGLRKAQIAWTPGVPFAAVAIAVWWLGRRNQPSLAILTASAAVLVGIAYVKVKTFPALDQRVSVRAFWQANESRLAGACYQDVNRPWQYGINYYARHALSECGPAVPGGGPEIVVRDRRLELEPRSAAALPEVPPNGAR